MKVAACLLYLGAAAGQGLAAELSQSTSFVVGAVVVDECRVARSIASTTLQEPPAGQACTSEYVDRRDVSEPITEITVAKDGSIIAIRIEF